MTRRALLWLVPLFLALHNIEEVLTVQGSLADITAKIPGWAAHLFPAGVVPPTVRQYGIAIAIVTALPYLFALLPDSRRSPRTFLLASLQMVMLINVFAHIWLMNMQNGYVPGLITALVFNLPFSLYFFACGLRQGWLHRTDFAYLTPIALLLHGPGLFGLLALSARLAVV